MNYNELVSKLENIENGELFILKMKTKPNGLTAAAKKAGYEIIKETVALVKTGLEHVNPNPVDPTKPARKSHITHVIKNRVLLNGETGKYLLRVNVDEDCEFIPKKTMFFNGKPIEWDETKLTKSYKKGSSNPSPVLSIGIDNIVDIEKSY